MRYPHLLYNICICILLLATGCLEDPVMEGGLKNAKKPTVETLEILSTHATSVRIKGEVKQENGAPVTEAGFCWGDQADFAFQSTQSTAVTERKAKFEAQIEHLQANHDYYIRAYAINAVDTAFGDPLSFHTADGLGSVKTLHPTNIFSTKVDCAGMITAAGEAEVEQRGFYLMSKPTPSASDSLILIPMQTDSFYCTITGLIPSTTYYLRAYAANRFGSFNGAQVESFTTTDGLPTLDNESFKLITTSYHYADFQLSITEEGDSPVTAWGFCFSKQENPTIEQGDTVVCGEGFGTFIGRISKLEQQTKYYVRGYAKNSAGVCYTEAPGLPITLTNAYPTVKTNPVNSYQIKETYIIVGGEVLTKGASPIIETGVCWSTSSQVYLENAIGHKALGNSMGQFVGKLEGLRGGITYYLKAYATNKNGTAYGEEITFSLPAIFTQMSAFPGDQYIPESPAYTTIENIGFLLGGDKGSEYASELWAYGVRSKDEWMQLRSQPKALSKQILFQQGFGLWAFGGLEENNRVSNDLYFYSALFNIWENMTEKQQNKPQGIYHAANCVQDGKAFVVGGCTAQERTNAQVWSFDIETSCWTQKPDFPIAQYGGIALSVDNAIYAGLGIVNQDIASPNYSRQLWSSSDGAITWQEETPFPGTDLKGAVALNQLIYGVDDAGYIWCYDTRKQTWSQKSQLPTANRSFHCIFLLNGKIYIGLGAGTDTLVKYDPSWDNAL